MINIEVQFLFFQGSIVSDNRVNLLNLDNSKGLGISQISNKKRDEEEKCPEIFKEIELYLRPRFYKHLTSS